MTGSSRVGVRPISLRLLLKCWAKLGQEKRKKKKKKSHSALSRHRMTFPWALASRGGWLRYDDIDIILCCGVQTECYSCLKISPSFFLSFAFSIFFDMAISSLTHPSGLKCIVVNRCRIRSSFISLFSPVSRLLLSLRFRLLCTRLSLAKVKF